MQVRSVVVGLVAVALLLPVSGWAQSNIFRSAYTASSSSNATGIATGDIDGDGFIDVVTTNAGGGNEVNILIGFGDGEVSGIGAIELPSLPSALSLAKFDSDNIADLVVGLANEDAITFLHGRGDIEGFDPPGASIKVGGSVAGLLAVDFTGDGKLDIITANDGGDSAPGSVSFLRGDGLGGFTLLLQNDPSHPGETVQALLAELGTRAVAVGNIDADPELEVLAVNARANSAHGISIFDGDGTGAFTPGGSIATGGAPQDLRLIDLDGDGKLDLLVANSNDDTLSVQHGLGNKTFGPATTYAVGTAPTHLAVGDMDGNDTVDVVVSNSRSGDVTVLRGDGMGGFGGARTWVAEAEPQALALADFNDDQLLDVATAAQGGSSAAVVIQSNRGDGVLHAVEDVASGNGPSAVTVADIDDDGLPDLVSSGDSGTVSIQFARPDGFSVPQTIAIGGRTRAVVAVDLNADGRPDIAVVDNENNRVVVALATGASTFGPAQPYSVSTGPSAITTGDFNGDHLVDLAVTTIGPPGRAAVLLQQPGGTGTFGPARSTAVQETPIGIRAVDINCDGKDDLVVANQASAVVTVLRSAGDGTFVVAQEMDSTQVGGQPSALAVGDFNRDGVGDLAVSDSVAAGPSPTSVRTFLGSCTGPFTFKQAIRAGDLVSAVVARDFTGDGLVDIGVVNQTSNAVKVLTGVGDGMFRANAVDVVSRMPVSITAGDFDGDGRFDAATANSDPSANNLSVLYNCARDPECSQFTTIPGRAALRGDGNGDGVRSAADFVAVAREVIDGDGQQVEQINLVVDDVPLDPDGYAGDPGVDANGDGLVSAQDRGAVARRIFGGA
ncbi:MAG: VCBS repeat-containing protein [bacterium]